MSLSSLIAALGEGNAEHELNFDNVFISTPDYRAVAGMSRALILGGRGTGKSAIFRRMIAHPEGGGEETVLAVPLAADRTSWPALEQAAKASNNDLVVLSRQWELTLLLLAFNRLVEDRRDVKRKRLIRDLDAEVNKVLERTELNLTSEGMLTDVFEAAATILRKLPFTFKVQAPFVPVSIELKDSQPQDQPTAREQEKLQIILVEGMYGIVGSLLEPSMRVQILADQLDDFWKGSSPQIASLCALITAVMRMKGVLVQRGMDRGLRFTIFLRSDIYDVLKANGLDDATKYRRHELHLKWDIPALQRLINRRIEVGNVDGVTTIGEVFADGRVDRRPLADYFFARVVPRPRDVIQFLGLCLDEAELRGETRVTAETLVAAEATYSAWRRDVILEEARYGGMRSPDSILSSLSSGPRTYPPKELRRRLDETKREYGITETKPQITTALVDWGVLGVQRSRGETQFIWDVQEGKRPSPSENDDEYGQEAYIVHPSLWSALDLRPPRKPKPRAERPG